MKIVTKSVSEGKYEIFEIKIQSRNNLVKVKNNKNKIMRALKTKGRGDGFKRYIQNFTFTLAPLSILFGVT